MTDQQINRIGRLETFKMLLIAATLTVVLPTLFAIVSVAVTCGFHCLNFNSLLGTLTDKWTYLYILISGIILTSTIYFLGPWTARQIIKQNKNTFVAGTLTFIYLWTVWFISSMIISCIETKAHMDTERSLLSIIADGWWFYSFIICAPIAVVTSAIFGHFLGRQIKRKGDKLASL